jgi:integrase
MRGQGRVFRPKVRGKQTTVWWLDYSIRGKRFRESTHTTSKSGALEILRQRVGDRKAGKLSGSPDRLTLGDLRKGLERHYQRMGNSSLRRAQQAFDHIEQFLFSDTRALYLTKQRLGEYLEHRLRVGASRATVRYEIAVLNAAFSVAVEEELLVMRPMFKLPTVCNARSGFFEDGDFAALLLELPNYLRPVIRFARMTGWRKSEVLSLTWSQVDWDGEIIRVNAGQTKSGDARAFPFGLAGELKDLLKAQWEIRNGLLVFHRRGRPIKSFRSAWKLACKRVGLDGRLVHDLRRTAARDYRRAGVSEGEIMQLCGWKTRAMFDRYNIIDEADRAAAVAKRFNGKQAANKGAPTGGGASLNSVPANGAA